MLLNLNYLSVGNKTTDNCMGRNRVEKESYKVGEQPTTL